MEIAKLIKKYNVPVPRYTSYPTIPMWGKTKINQIKWEKIVQQTFQTSNHKKGISLYIHLPYCDKLCLFCACNKRITSDHGVQTPYINAVISEWKIYLQTFQEKPIIKELHLGGGTPTFFSPENLQKLVLSIKNKSILHKDFEFSFEAHPNSTTSKHLNTLYKLGFRRMSLGVQDFNQDVQKAVDRIHSFEVVQNVTELARQIGYQSINYDLIYGLPKQQAQGIQKTMECVSKLKPDRIALYSFARVPWIAKSQQFFNNIDLPEGAQKQKLYELSKQALLKLGYVDIGTDHFALKTDSLYLANKAKKLHRNFMGYNTWKTDLLIGLGVSSISDAKNAYAQNTKNIEQYIQATMQQKFHFERTHQMTQNDQVIKKAILDILCKKTLKITNEIQKILDPKDLKILEIMKHEQLIHLEDNMLSVSNLGMMFIRNICSVFDQYQPKQNFLFSQSL